MEILFAGICLIVKKETGPGAVAVFPRASKHVHNDGGNGHSHNAGETSAGNGDGANGMPEHTVFIMAPEGSVDYRRFGPPIRLRMPQGPRLMFALEGEEVTFDPPPKGSLDDIPLASVNTICPNGVFRRSLVTSPTPERVGGLVQIPGGTMSSALAGNGTTFVRLIVPDGVTIKARPFGSTATRELIVLDSKEAIVMANVVLPDIFLGRVDGTHHNLLYCDLLEDGGGHQHDVLHEPVTTTLPPIVALREAEQVSTSPDCVPVKYP